ncbi:MAG: hypothetical protein LAO51_06040 [Acidobacteriia bacterium]|nr:hypothetical protein [Terriglobia bacterium]
MAKIISPNRHQQPHDLKPGEQFDAACIYISDRGAVYCGAHVGTEASFTPWAWSCLGLGTTFTNPDDGIVFACETCYPRGFRAGR